MFTEANALFRVELNRTPPEDREPLVEEFLLAIAGLESHRGGDYIEASVRLQWANTCVMLQNLPRAVQEITKSETAFNGFCDHFDLTNIDTMPHMQALEYEKLSCIQDPIERLDRTEALASRLEQVGGIKTDMCLSDAAELAILFYRVTSSQEYQDKYFDLQSRLERYDETVSEDITELVMHRNDLISVTISSLVDRQKSLEWIDGFLKQYPHFSSPRVLSSLYKSQSSVLRALRRIDEANRADDNANELEGSWPSIGKWMQFRSAPSAVPLGGPSSSPVYESEDEDVEEPFFWPWRHAIGEQVKSNQMAINLLWEWALDDVTTGHLAIEDFKRMMNLSDTQIANIVRPEKAADMEDIRTKKATDIASIVFIRGSDVDAPHDDSYDRICKWLSEAPRGHRSRRLFCLVMLRDGRQSYFSDMKMWDLRIRELHHLLELEPTLPRPIRETFPRNRGSWLGALAMTHIALLETVSDFTGAKPLEHLLDAERCNGLALDEFRQTKDRGSVALHQRSGAQICMLEILRLQQLSRQVTAGAEGVCTKTSNNLSDACVPLSENTAETADEIRRLRAVGTEKIKEADEIMTDSEIHASWSDGLDAVTHRQEITAFHGSGHTARTAISLLLAEAGEPLQETVSSVWGWVQKYKARSLARAIGGRSYDPPDLVSSIMASSDVRPLYEEMLRLEKRILETEPMARFELRRQLDAHLEAIKREQKHTLLRQLIDLREASPFDISDIATIEAQAGTPIVLVDWFYLPPYIDGEAGKMLLFTARAGSEPTMDFLTTKEEDIIAWQRDYLFPLEGTGYREENLNAPGARGTFDKMLGGLVAPLVHRTNPNEVLVLCPSSILHRVPLHALSLRIDDPFDPEEFSMEGLIHRNPVVYTHSHSLLRSCFTATEHARYSPGSMNARFLSGIPEDEASYYNEETKQRFDYTKGRDSIRELARRFDTTPMMDGSASKEQFLSAATQSRLLHLHTHCNWKSGDPLDHHVEFPRADGPAGKQPAKPLTRPVERLTARELFDVRVPPSTHVNMIACQGGVTDVKLGDEVMGLVPALLYSGASSTISTLWSIADGDGAMFAKYFFDSFLQQCAGQNVGGIPGVAGQPETNGEESKSGENRSVGFVDLAKATRVAVTKLDDEGQTLPLYKWAGFVLHGFWQFPLLGKDMEWLQAQRR
ncbi:CHAT domain-containing protein [Xylariales sp. AK1849]|nr:CHAT domain-containing protein [Xylariales sp. AK1849]